MLQGVDGDSIGWAKLDGDSGSIALRDFGRFDFDLRESTVDCRCPDATPDEVVADAWQRSALPWALHAAGAAVLHASAVSTAGGVLLLAGVSGAGKSTLASGLQRLGHPLYADDVVPLVTDGAGRMAAAFVPFRPKGPDGEALGPMVGTPPDARGPAQIDAVVVLRSAPPGPGIELLDGGAAFRALMENAYCLPPYDSTRARRTMEALLGLASSVPVYELRFEPTGRAEPATLGALVSVQRATVTPALARRRAGLGFRELPGAARMGATYLLLRSIRRWAGPRRQANVARRLRFGAGSAVEVLKLAAKVFPAQAANGCFERSLVVAGCLADAGLDPSVVVGWSADLGIGHAWVEVDGLPVLDDRVPDSNFEEVWRFAHDGPSPAHDRVLSCPRR